MFTKEYIDSLPKDPLLALSKVTDKTLDFWDDIPPNSELNNIDFFLEAYAISNGLIEHLPEIRRYSPNLNEHQEKILDNLIVYFKNLKVDISKKLISIKTAHLTEKYSALLGNSFSYEFSEGDLKRIQELINQLRDHVTSSDYFDENHKTRLLSRLEKLQSELHKKMPDLDRFWGLIGDAGVAIGKLGKDAKPFVKRIKEISDIIWRTQSRAEELPSDTPMDLLSSSDDSET
ncbi:hypothetical protein SAMN05216361_1506 [Marisediminitalea aggregata]|uniref:Uncharacterized protein n=1 Tax=Marisediminitalea aggregata TaxID=634436 RepID=A0A1M5HKI6_9ALTE|nr:hypothetical protein [Marisediminitalea aggregata]SHG16342.1 hypothetical protein SAMN05216361_1506 [Marisediminitalea aggregata]